MVDPAYAIRSARDEDLPAEVEVLNRLTPEAPISVEDLRHRRRLNGAPPRFRVDLVAEERTGGPIVAFGELEPAGFAAFDPRRGWLQVFVDPPRQGHGIGRALADELATRAQAHGMEFLYTAVRADVPRDVAFLHRQGFVERRRSWLSVLEVTPTCLEGIPDGTDRLAEAGLRFTTLAEEGGDRPEVRAAVHRAYLAAREGIPTVVPTRPVSESEFVARNLEAPGVLPDAFFLARWGREYVGLSFLERLAEPSSLLQVFTGTRPDWRRRGVALELKRRGIAYAQSHGIARIRTYNDSLNIAMWTINQRLGFTRQQEHVQGERRLAPARPGSA